MIAYAFDVPGWGAGLLHYDGAALIDLEEPADRRRTGTPGASAPGARELATRIAAYLAGGVDDFADVDIEPACAWFGLTVLDRRMVAAIRTIPRGETASYREVAELAGRPRAARSAGAACARGPLSIVVPYHRVIRSDGGIGMYGALGDERKRRLLALEGVDAR
ncbi:MAG: methylated-DNA--[protein]-cysteine S-methyltransferase [Gaiellales bacterium]